MPLHRDPQIQFERRVRRVTAAGIELPPAATELKTRFTEFRKLTDRHPVRDRLVAALLVGADADLGALWAAAKAEALDGREVLETLRVKTNAAIRAVYAEHAVDNYCTLATRFDYAASQFLGHASVVDPETDPDAVVDASEKVRKAWRGAELSAGTMTQLLPALAAAAALAGFCDDEGDDGTLLALSVDPGEADPVQLWEAWLTEDRLAKAENAARSGSAFTTEAPPRYRCGRWTALRKLNVILRAHPAEPVQPLRRPSAVYV